MKHHHQETDNNRWVATLRCGILLDANLLSVITLWFQRFIDCLRLTFKHVTAVLQIQTLTLFNFER